MSRCQCGADVIGTTINTVRRSDCETVSKLDRLAAREGPLAAQDRPLAGLVGPLADRVRRSVDGRCAAGGWDGPMAARDGLVAV